MSTKEPQILAIGDLEMDLALREVRRGGERLDVPKLSFRLLEVLARAAPGVVSHEVLLDEVWSGVVVGEETVKQRVKLLRDALGDDSAAPRYLATVRGHGYRLVAPVRAVEPEVPASRPVRRAMPRLALLAVLGALLAVAWLSLGRSSPEPPRPAARLAVLPLDGEPDDRVLALGLQSELIAQLARIDGLVVRSRASVERFAGPELRPRIGPKLQVDAVLEGRVLRSAEELRLDLSLVDAREDHVLWSLRHDGAYSVEEIFTVQSRIAREVAAELLGAPGPPDATDRTLRPTPDLAAYEAYLQGVYELRQLDFRGLRRAEERLETAVELDPEFAPAWSALAQAVAFSGTNYGWRRPVDVFSRSLAASDRALALDPGLVDARVVRANVLFWRDWDARAALDRLAEIDRDHPPGDSTRLARAYVLSTEGRHDEAVAEARRAVEAYPGDPVVASNLAWRLRDAGRFEEMRQVAQGVLDEDPGFADARGALGQALLFLGRYEQAAAVFRDLNYRTSLALTLALAGDEEGARELLGQFREETEAGGYFNPEALAEVRIALGDVDEAFDLLERAIADRQRAVLLLDQLPLADRIRDDPRYEDLLLRIRGETGGDAV